MFWHDLDDFWNNEVAIVVKHQVIHIWLQSAENLQFLSLL
jgi:hypothetical protein